MNQHSIQQAQQSQQSIHTPPLIYKIKQYQANSFLSNFSYALIRPPRFMYNQQLLYPPQHYQLRYRVQHHQIPFKLTLYKTDNMLYVILYLHGNSSSRFQGYMQLRDLPDGVGLACFDFNGCGMRFQSDYITLGAKESKDVDIAVRYLKKLGYPVVGWGRSMGSVSLLISQEADVMIADSPFYSLEDLCRESSYSVTPAICCCFFHCLYPCLFSCVRSDVQQKAGFDVRDLQVAKIVASNPRNKQRSLLIMAGTQDSMIRYHHSQRIYNAFPGTKQIQLFAGTHNSNRPQQILQKCYKFIQKQLGIQRKPSKKQTVTGIKLKAINKLQPLNNEHKQRTKQSSLREQTQAEELSRTNTKQKLINKIEEIKQQRKQQRKQKSIQVQRDIQKSMGKKESQKEEDKDYDDVDQSGNFNTITTVNNMESSTKMGMDKSGIKDNKSGVEVQSMDVLVKKVHIHQYKTKETQLPNYVIKGKKLPEIKKPAQTSFQIAIKQQSKIQGENSQIQLIRKTSAKKQEKPSYVQQQYEDNLQENQTPNTLINK